MLPFHFEELTIGTNERFTQASNRTFQLFDTQRKHAWQGAYFFMQLVDTQQKEAKHIFVFLHHPMFLKEADEPDQYFNIPLERRTPLLEQLKQAKVRAIFAGHYHRNSHGWAEELEMITTGPVGRPLGKDPSGFRIVKVHEQQIEHQYYAVDEVPSSVDLSEAAAK